MSHAVWPTLAHVEVPHTPPPHSFEQHCDAPVQLDPAGRHGGGATPQVKSLQVSPEQQSLVATQLAPVPAHAGPVAQVPPTQALQQLVSLVHGVPFGRHEGPVPHWPSMHCRAPQHSEFEAHGTPVEPQEASGGESTAPVSVTPLSDVSKRASSGVRLPHATGARMAARSGAAATKARGKQRGVASFKGGSSYCCGAHVDTPAPTIVTPGAVPSDVTDPSLGRYRVTRLALSVPPGAVNR